MSTIDITKINVFDAFAQVEQSYKEAEEKAKQEAGAPRVERFRTDKDKDYSIRILPLAPNFDAEGNILPMDRQGYEYPLIQQFIAIATGKKGKKINIPVCRATQKGIDKSLDLIDEYVRICREMYGDDDDLMEKINNSPFYGGLKWSYMRCIYILNMDDKRQGPLLWQPSFSQYKDLDEARLKAWAIRNKKAKDGEVVKCPIAAFSGANLVTVTRTTENKRTSYKIALDYESERDDLTQEELQTLIETPRIPEIIYHFSRYALEAEKVFLEQYDEENGTEVCKEQDFIDAFNTIAGELDPEDKSHFDITKASSADKGGNNKDITLDYLWNKCDYLADNNLGATSDEAKELREEIRQYIEENNIDIRLSHSKSNEDLLNEIEEYEEEHEGESQVTPEPESKKEPEEETEKEGPAKEAEETPRRRRATRPADESEEAPEAAESTKLAEEAPAEEEVPSRRRRRLRQG